MFLYNLFSGVNMTLKLLKGLFVICLITIGSLYQANAQAISDYIVQEYSGSFVPNSSPAATLNPAGDEGQLNFTMPFNFTFDNTLITLVHMNSNGFLTMNYNWETAPNNPYYGGPSPGTNPMVMSWVGADMGNNGFMNVQLSGSAPNRVVTCEWNAINFYYNSGSCTFQIKFYEGSNIIEFVSGGFTLSGSGYIYVSGASAANYINIQPGQPRQLYIVAIIPVHT